MTEASRAGIRIISNYARLFLVVALGLVLVKVLLRTLGPDAVGVISLIAATVGIATIIEEIVGWSMVREFGAAHHAGQNEQFRQLYNSAMVLCALATLVTLLIYAAIVLLLPALKISPEMLVAARWFVVAKAIESAATVLLAPQFNMYLVLEWMVGYNAWIVLRRASLLTAALMLYVINPSNPSEGLIWYGMMSSGLHVLTLSAAAMWIVLRHRELVPQMRSASRAGMSAIISISGWNVGILGSQLLSIPAGQILMNLAFGVMGNLIFGFAVQLGGYIRMITSGMTGGLDAVSARLTTSTGEVAPVRRMMRVATMLHALVVFPAMAGCIVLAGPLIQLWIGNDLPQGAPELSMAAALTRIMAIGFSVMAIADGWFRIMYGAGHIHRYAPIAISGGFANFVLAVVLLLIMPESIRYTAVAWAFSISYLVFFLVLLPQRTADAFAVGGAEVVQPLIRPLVVAVACSPLLFLAHVGQGSLLFLVLAVAAYGIGYTMLAWSLVLSQAERARLLSAASRIKASAARPETG